jgi:hypothetical protein
MLLTLATRSVFNKLYVNPLKWTSPSCTFLERVVERSSLVSFLGTSIFEDFECVVCMDTAADATAICGGLILSRTTHLCLKEKTGGW